MSLQTLELEELHLSLASENLLLDIASTVDVRFQARWDSSHDIDSIVKALTSGYVWVSRGRQCRLDIEVTFDGKALQGTCRTSILESLGYHLRDTYLWNQLPVSTALDISSSQVVNSAADMSIYINNEISLAKTEPKAWLLRNIDIKAPESVLCAEFERCRIQMKFRWLQKGSQSTSKRLKSASLDSDSLEPMLLDHASAMEEENRTATFEEIAAVLRDDLPSQTAKHFDRVETSNCEHLAQLDGEMLLSLDNRITIQQSSALPLRNLTLNRTMAENESGMSSRHPKDTIDILKSWISTNPGKSKLTEKDKLKLMGQTGLRRSKLLAMIITSVADQSSQGQLVQRIYDAWSRPTSKTSSEASSRTFHNTEKQDHICQPPQHLDEILFNAEDRTIGTHPKDEMLLGEAFADQEADEMLFNDDVRDLEEDEIMLSQTTSVVPSLVLQPSTMTNISSSASLKRPAINEIIEFDEIQALTTSLPISAKKLAFVALCTLIAGPSNWKRDLRGAKILKPPPSLHLSLFVPSMFCPGFKEILAHNSKSLPTIFKAITCSCVRNVQGVGLRSKLIELSNAKISKYYDGGGEVGSAERLAAVVQGRIWTMMQRTLYDEGSVRKLWRKDDATDTDNTNYGHDACFDEDILVDIQNTRLLDPQERNFEDDVGGGFVDDDENWFDDLLIGTEVNGSDAGLLGYLEEQERLATEAETDDMLLGSDYCQSACISMHDRGSVVELLSIGGGSQEDSMLL